MSTHSYIGRRRCGCVTAMVTDQGDKFTGKTVAEFIGEGLTIERVTNEEAVRLFQRCPHTLTGTQLALEIPCAA